MCFSRGIVEYLLLLVVNVEDLTRLELKETRHARQPGSLPRFLGKAEVLSCDKDKDENVKAEISRGVRIQPLENPATQVSRLGTQVTQVIFKFVRSFKVTSSCALCIKGKITLPSQYEYQKAAKVREE